MDHQTSTLKPVDKIGLQVETKAVMPHASQRYSENTAFSNRAVTRDGAFVKFSRTVNCQARTKNCTFASLTPSFYNQK